MASIDGSLLEFKSPPSWEGMRVLVLGAGRSGLSAARLLLRVGARVALADQGAGRLTGCEQASLSESGVRLFLEGAQWDPSEYDLAVVSPGIPIGSTWPQVLMNQGVPVIGELELGAYFIDFPIVGVTGTNGKSTLVTLLGHIFSQSGMACVVGGNLGTPLSEWSAHEHPEISIGVIEISSFQLESIQAFRPDTAVLLNLQPDHLDRHGTMEHYLDVKSRIFSQMLPGQLAVIHQPLKASLMERYPALLWCGVGPGGALYYDADSASVIVSPPDREVLSIDLSGTTFADPVRGVTAAAAVAVARHYGLSVPQILTALTRYTMLEHRMEFVRELDGVKYVNDSKATNMAALGAALEIADGPVRLIAGGILKENDLSWTKEVLKKHAVCVYVIGQCHARLIDEWSAWVDCKHCDDLAVAVREARADAVSGDMVLLSPGCASFDQFRSFEDRGVKFKAVVESLQEREM